MHEILLSISNDLCSSETPSEIRVLRLINQSVLNTLKDIVGPENLVLDQSSLEAYSVDALGRGRGRNNSFSQPQVYAAVRPTSTVEVSEITKVAHAELIPLIPYGGGTGVAGAVVPLQSGLAVDLKGMHRIIEISAEDRTATVEAGIILGDLDNVLRQNGLMLGHDPYSVPIATIGGAISTNGVGYRASKYGSMGDQVLGLEIVLPNGDIVQTRAIPKSSTGPLCFNKPSNVSIERLSPLNFKYLFSKNITILKVCKL